MRRKRCTRYPAPSHPRTHAHAHTHTHAYLGATRSEVDDVLGLGALPNVAPDCGDAVVGGGSWHRRVAGKVCSSAERGEGCGRCGVGCLLRSTGMRKHAHNPPPTHRGTGMHTHTIHGRPLAPASRQHVDDTHAANCRQATPSDTHATTCGSKARTSALDLCNNVDEQARVALDYEVCNHKQMERVGSRALSEHARAHGTQCATCHTHTHGGGLYIGWGRWDSLHATNVSAAARVSTGTSDARETRTSRSTQALFLC